ncbi:LPS export ABC transporter periplasmic protein LptC [Vampirovibrio chlorellavorus]|uniref:LPS export ABC transporter periplasmic protein LptC n=1 Tax=Vampirovibrio chlorellavorus TaxID=758823 RepID=UPI0026EBAA27|nr:LPS export ABC transporter periplasmic protein LptC [Vampirovibrio chlorellavorus]
MNSYRKLVIFVLSALVLGGGWAIWNADQKLKQEEALHRQQQASQNKQDSMTGQNVSFTVTEGKVKKWKLEALNAVYSENRAQATLKEVKGEFYDAEGKPVLQFSAPEGLYLTKDNTVTLSGGVIANSAQKQENGGKGGQMKAPTMTWSGKSDWVTAKGGAELTFPQGKSTAQTCRFTLDFSNIQLEGGVNSSLSPL